MTLYMSSECLVRYDEYGDRKNAHEPDKAPNVRGMIRNPWTEHGMRQSAHCRFCQSLIFSNYLVGHMTRDVRWGKWYHEDFIITEWP